jgi:DnaJ-class molecular chaperone
MADGIGMASVAASVLTKNIGGRECNRSICGRCRGKGFDSFEKSRASRTCPHCKGEGTKLVGSTKR